MGHFGFSLFFERVVEQEAHELNWWQAEAADRSKVYF